MTASFPRTFILPPGFRHADFLRFHARDSQGVAEAVSGHRIRKGLVWDGRPAVLQLVLDAELATAELSVDHGDADFTPPPPQVRMFDAMIRRMLGLDQPIGLFESQFAEHGLIGELLQRQAGLRVPQCATPFEALAWAITGQQISLSAAISLRRRLIQAANISHRSGLLCYPSAAVLADIPLEQMRMAGFSQSKAATLRLVSQLYASGELPFDDWLEQAFDADIVRRSLLAIKGIGPWTADYTLLRGFGWLDGSLHGDAAVRRALRRWHAKAEDQPLTEAQAMAWLLPFSPWRALLAAHLWASLSISA